MNTNNLERFKTILADQYTQLFETPDYAMAKRLHTPESMAHKMTIGLHTGSADKDGEGIKRTCKALGIKHTYKAIREYLDKPGVTK